VHAPEVNDLVGNSGNSGEFAAGDPGSNLALRVHSYSALIFPDFPSGTKLEHGKKKC
jgi:hypothetical protein